VTFYGLADSSLVGTELGEVFEIHVRREDPEASLRDVLADEPGWAGLLSVVGIEFSLCWNC
jgi:hypothetical protein